MDKPRKFLAFLGLGVSALLSMATMCEPAPVPGELLDTIEMDLEDGVNVCGSAVNVTDWNMKGELRADSDDNAYWVTVDNRVLEGDRDDNEFEFEAEQSVLWRQASGGDPGCSLKRRDTMLMTFDEEEDPHWSGTYEVYYHSSVGCALNVDPDAPCTITFELSGEGDVDELPEIDDES